MSGKNGNPVEYVEIRYRDGSAQTLSGGDAQKWFEEMLQSFFRDIMVGHKPKDHQWQHIKKTGEEDNEQRK